MWWMGLLECVEAWPQTFRAVFPFYADVLQHMISGEDPRLQQHLESVVMNWLEHQKVYHRGVGGDGGVFVLRSRVG